MIGKVRVPSVKKLLPDRWTHIEFALHSGTSLIGAAAIVCRDDSLSRVTGLALIATATWLLRGWIHVLRYKLDVGE